MVKFGYVKCEECEKEVCKKQLKRHKCNPKVNRVFEKCTSCGKEVILAHFARHTEKCLPKNFWKTHQYFFCYFLRVVRAFNRELRKEAYLGNKEAKKQIIMKQYDKERWETDLRKNQKQLNDEAKEREDEILKIVRETAEELKIDFEKEIKKEAIKDLVSFCYPGLSCREIIFTYLKNTGFDNKRAIALVDKKLRKKDYPLDDELKDNKKLFEEIQEARNKCDYHVYFQRFYQMLQKYFISGNAFVCFYCKKCFSNMKKHLRRCEPCRKLFNGDTGKEEDNRREMTKEEEENKEKIIKFYLEIFHGAALWEEWLLKDYINYYKRYSYNYFIETIERRVKNRRAFREKIEEGRKEFRRRYGCNDKKSFLRDLISEVDAMPAWEDEKEKKDEEENNMIEEKEVNNTIEENIKEKEEDCPLLTKAIEKVERGRDEVEEKHEELDVDKCNKTWAILLGGKFKAKLEEKNSAEISSSEDEKDDVKDHEEADLLKELEGANVFKDPEEANLFKELEEANLLK